MKVPSRTNPDGPTALVIPLPSGDYRIYAEALRVLRRLMGRRSPTLESLLLHDLRGRDADGIVDNFLDASNWPLERGRSITVRIREREISDGAVRRGRRRTRLKIVPRPIDLARN